MSARAARSAIGARGREGASADGSAWWGNWLAAVALGIALAAVVGRATVLETLRDSYRPAPGAEVVPQSEPGPAGSLVLDLVCLLPALLVLARRVVEPGRKLVVRRAHLWLGAFALLAVASVGWADDRFAALVGSMHLVAAAALFFAATQLVRDPRRLRLLAGVMLGLLLICLAQAAEYRWSEMPALVADFQKNRLTIFKQRGWEPDSFTAQQFEKKVLSGQPIGFYFSANTFAAVLVLLGVIGAGMALQRRADRDHWGWWVTILPVVAGAAWVDWTTRCRAALVTPMFAAGVMVVARFGHGWMGRHRRGVFALAMAAVAVAVAGVVTAGKVHGGLWQDSLTFRWRYWIGSMRMFRARPWLGVGWENFGAHYLAVRLQSAAEEIQDPHNFVVRAATELGAVGLVLILAWLVSAAWEATAPAGAGGEMGGAGKKPTDGHPWALGGAADERGDARRLVGAILLPVVLGIGINIVASIDFTETSSYVLVELLKRSLFLGLLLLGTILGYARNGERPVADDRAAPWVRWALLAALASFVLHNTIEFSMFETGPMMLVMFLAGAAIGVGRPVSEEVKGKDARRGGAGVALVVGVLVWCAVGVVAVRMLEAESLAQAGDEAYRTSRFAEAAELLARAEEAAPVANSDYLARRGEVLIVGGAEPGEIRRAMEGALAADPTNVRAARTLARFEIRQARPDAAAFRAAFERMLALDPSDVDARVEYADGLLRLGMPDAAAVQYRMALEKNEMYDATEPKRLGAGQVGRIRQLLAGLR